MLKVLKYLKQSLLSVLVIVILLCIQAMTDLSLPDYTSKIVNIGIQQSGIQQVAPEVIRKTQMENLLLFTQEDDNILQDYTLLSKTNLDQKEYEDYVKKYPELKNQDLYLQNKLEKTQQQDLNSWVAKPLMVVSYLSSEEMEQTVKQQLLANLPEEQQQLVKDLPILDVIKQMPEQQLNPMLEQINQKLDQMQGSMIEQAAIGVVKQEYREIGINTDDLQNQYILMAGAKMLAVAFVSMLAAVTIMLLSSRVAAKLGKTLREKVFSKVLDFSSKEFREFSTASLITRSTNDIQQIQMLITMLFRVIIYAPIIGIGGFFKVLHNSDQSMAWIIGLAIASILVIVMVLFIVAMPRFQKLQKLIDRLNEVSREILTGLPVIRAFHKEKQEEGRFNVANTNLMQNYVFVNRAMSIMMPALMLVMNGISILIIWVGGHNVEAGMMQVGDMMAFIQYTMQIVMAFLMISMISIMLPRASVSAKRINEVLEAKLTIQEQKNSKSANPNKKGLVEFKDVSFRYPDADEELLNDITFTAHPGKTTAIIGSTGSGKSTIINLIPRFYDVTRGELLIDGVNVKDLPLKQLREKIGFVPQKGVLFSGTIESNIKYGKPEMSDEMMKKAAEIAQATEFIESKQEGYQTEIAQGGTNVSGGQKQRLSIARAIAKDPEIFVFDDSFSALDFKTDANLRQALKENVQDKTIIIVAQRISTILNADQIIVLEEGRIVGIGTHEELMKSNETYRQIALSQLSKEELE